MRALKPLLVGELNPYGADPAFALYPLPGYASGGRLQVILDLTLREYLDRFDRVNLCTGRWSMGAARQAANEIALVCPRTVVLLGRRVASAFGMSGLRPFTVVDESRTSVVVHHGFLGANRYVLLPHPSGRCRAWNDAGAARLAREVVGT